MGGSVEYQFVPILKLISTLLTMGVLASLDVHKILLLIEPNVFGEQREEAVGGGGSGGGGGGDAVGKEGMSSTEEKAVEAGEAEAKDAKQPRKGLLEKRLPESVKRQVGMPPSYACVDTLVVSHYVGANACVPLTPLPLEGLE